MAYPAFVEGMADCGHKDVWTKTQSCLGLKDASFVFRGDNIREITYYGGFDKASNLATPISDRVNLKNMRLTDSTTTNVNLVDVF